MAQQRHSSIANISPPTFIHSLFRSGSTYLYNALKRTGGYHVYHEPFHEAIESLPDGWNELQGRTPELKSKLRHDFLDGSYFDEYAHLLPYIRNTFDASISYELFFLDRNTESTQLKAYLDCLIQGANARPVFQCTRTIGRVDWIRANYSSSHVFLLRNPWDQWFSYKVDQYISATPQLVYSQPRVPAVLSAIADASGFNSLPGTSLRQQFEYSRVHPRNADTEYFLFFGLWAYAYLVAQPSSDLSLNMDAITSQKAKRVEAEKALATIGLRGIDLSDCELHRATYRPDESAFFEHIEGQVIEIFKRHGLATDGIHEYLEQEREISFFVQSTNAKRRSMALEDASRLRGVLLRSQSTFAQVATSLNQQLVDRENRASALGSTVSGHQQDILRLTNETEMRDELVSDLEHQLSLSKQLIAERNAQLASAEENAIRREVELAESRKAIGELGIELGIVRQDLDERKTEVAAFLRSTAEKQAHLEILQQTISDRDEQIESLSKTLAESNATITSLAGDAAEREARMTLLQLSVEESETRVALLASNLTESESQRQVLQLASKEIEGKLNGMQVAAASKNEQLAALKRSTEDLRETVVTLKRTIGTDAEKYQQTIATRDRQLLRLNQALTERDETIAALNLKLAANIDQTSELSKLLVESDSRRIALEDSLLNLHHRITSLDSNAAERDRQFAALEQLSVERQLQITRLHEGVADRDRELSALRDTVRARYEDLDARNQALLERDNQISHLHRVVEDHATTIHALRSSRSWKITAPLRALSTAVKRNEPLISDTVHTIPVAAPGANAFFTICSKNFLAHARTLYQSLHPHYPNARFFVVLCDRVDGFFDPALEPFDFVYLEDLQLPNPSDMAERYNITEFNTAVKPFAFAHLMEKYGFGSIVYLDPDLLFVDKMQELDDMLTEGAEAVLTPHLLQPAERDEVHDGKMLLYGIYNLGFLALRNTPDVRSFLSWWGRRLERDCVIRLDQGLFVDQKWADLIPAFIRGARVLHHPGYNVAYWNLPQRTITRQDNRWFANNQPLRFVHFSGNKIDDPDVFSRHSQQVTIDNIGVLRELLDHYRTEVFAQGHQFYRKLPYAFSWNGEAGQNLHTPQSLDMASAERSAASMPSAIQADVPDITLNRKPFRRLQAVRRALPVAQKLSGGWLPLAKRAWSTYRRNGLGHVKSKIVELSRFPTTLPNSPATEPLPTPALRRQKRLLYLDWAIPRPDQDAASVTAVMLLKIFRSLGYSVTFLPCSLKYEEGYYEALVATGIEVICYPAVQSTKDWLNHNAKDFDVCILARGPVAWPYLETLKACAPDLRLVFNTVDLHYLRELRQAELANDESARQSAMVTRDQEYELIRRCDLTIVLSTEELYTIRGEYPDALLTVLPVVFEDIPGATRRYADRQDILFIGSFPHLPNIDAVIYFAEQVFPLIQRRIPDIRFKVVGANPPDSILKLAANPAIEVLGYVKELAPLFEGVRLSVAPLRYGAGIKGKIGSSLCYGVPCVATPLATEGMGLTSGQNVLTGETSEEFANAVCQGYLDEDLWNHISDGGHRFALENYSVAVIGRRVGDMLWAVTEGWQAFESAYEIEDWNAFKHHSLRMTKEYERRILREQALLPQDDRESFHTHGLCCVCGRETEFLTSFMFATGTTPDGRPIPNWREHMRCDHCGLVNRVRAALSALHTLAPPNQDSRIYITEQLTSTYQWLHARYPRLQGHNCHETDRVPEEAVGCVKQSNLMTLSFADSSFDRVLSFDAIEHVPNPEKAFQEIYRVLADDGVLLFSVPFSADSPSDIVRASLNMDGTINHHLPAEYHGNPVDPEGGALCFRYFGWSLLDQLRAIGFCRVRVLAYWSERQGYLGKEQYLFIAQKRISA